MTTLRGLNETEVVTAAKSAHATARRAAARISGIEALGRLHAATLNVIAGRMFSSARRRTPVT
jgi:hypothetical protein